MSTKNLFSIPPIIPGIDVTYADGIPQTIPLICGLTGREIKLGDMVGSEIETFPGSLVFANSSSCPKPGLSPHAIHQFAHKTMAQIPDDERWRLQAESCYLNFRCGFPNHGLTVANRVLDRLKYMAQGAELPLAWVEEIKQLIHIYKQSLGLGQPLLVVPFESETDMVNFPESIPMLGITPIDQHGYTAYSMPFDHADLVKRVVCRTRKACPFGLQCNNPLAALHAIWRIVAIMRFFVEAYIGERINADIKAFEAQYDGLWAGWSGEDDDYTPYAGEGWAWDSQFYQSLGNCLGVMGLYDMEAYITDLHYHRNQNMSLAERDLHARWERGEETDDG